MPKRADGYQASGPENYVLDGRLFDSDTATGYERVLDGGVAAAISGLLDLGATPAAAKSLKAWVKYNDGPTLRWDYSNDGLTWTNAGSPVLSSHVCDYSSVLATQTLGTAIAARYWRVSLNNMEESGCGESRAMLLEIWAEDAGSVPIPEVMRLDIGTDHGFGDGTASSGRGDSVRTLPGMKMETAAGRGDRATAQSRDDGSTTKGGNG